jgi:hypothetical protein
MNKTELEGICPIAVADWKTIHLGDEGRELCYEQTNVRKNLINLRNT